MKKIYSIFLMLLFIYQSSQAQWTLEGNAFVAIARGLYFTDANTGYAAGAGGFISKTTDGGVTWTPQTSGVITDLRSVFFVDNNTGFMTGAAGVVLKTTDGGANWALSYLGTGTLRSVDFTSANTGFVAGSSGVIYKTTDGGNTFTTTSLGITSDVIQLHMADANNGYAVASGSIAPFDSGYVYKTSDGGNTWSQVYFNALSGYLGLAVADANTVYIGGVNQTILKTNDGGATWDSVYNGLFTGSFRSGYAVSPDNAYLVDDFGYIASTADGGANWKDTLISTAGFYSVYFVSSSLGYAGDGGGNIYKFSCTPPVATITFLNGILTSDNPTGNQWYLDGNPIAGAVNATYTPTQSGTYYTIVTNSSGCEGISNSINVVLAPWTALTSGVTNTLRSVYFINDSEGWVCGESSLGFAPILKTTNSGTTWTLINHPTAYALRAIQFVDANTGIIAGFNGTILRSADGGSTWDSIPSGTIQPLRSVYFSSHDTGYICGGVGTILKTIDAGQTWTAQNSGTVNDLINIRFVSNNIGYAVQSDGTFLNGAVLKTTDGGATWNSVYTNANVGLLGLSATNANTVYAGGKDQTIFKSTDGGINWNQVYTGVALDNLRGSSFLNENTVWMVGGTTSSAILYTNDGGTTWTDQTPLLGTFAELLGIHFPSPNVGFTVGTLGTILRYAPACAPPPAATAIEGIDTVCSGNTEQYSIGSVNGADSYNWSVPPGAVIVAGQGTTVIKVTFGDQSGQISVTSVSNLCGSGGTLSINITVNPSPQPTITFANSVLTSSDATGNQWYMNGQLIPGATSQNYTPTANGAYSVVVTNIYGCSGTSNVIDVIGTGINSADANSSMQIDPLPAHDRVSIQFPVTEHGSLSIYDATGRKIFEDLNISGNQSVVDVSSFTRGIYFVYLTDDGKLKAVQKLIVQ